ncbi:MAG: hypothetical protein P857_140 [Candidatus Xenolissoclinum pacificiensis L6]|uniref:Uncharacterized protein n=1 Tax=Candidatus Xenolissoclinum pacificiensis L6 TaxID=1401685 RepID=W2UYW3_9RICK|nr:MAG: hypothetical protein P857_140 [Candidatus Xenolissoclinum pacificiensis L6]
MINNLCKYVFRLYMFINTEYFEVVLSGSEQIMVKIKKGV